MKNLSIALGAVLAISAAAASLPAAAAPFTTDKTIKAPSLAIDVARRDRFERRGDRYYYNNRRGYRDRRAGYRRHNGFWFPPAAFFGGLVLNGIINDGQAFRGGDAHVSWCYNRYRSYDVDSNTYAPYSGGRRACNSPYN